MLEWHTNRWQADTKEGDLIWMDDATFQRYTLAWLEAQRIKNPTAEQPQAARQHCPALSYWKNCKDTNVHIYRFGDRAPQHHQQSER